MIWCRFGGLFTFFLCKVLDLFFKNSFALTIAFSSSSNRFHIDSPFLHYTSIQSSITCNGCTDSSQRQNYFKNNPTCEFTNLSREFKICAWMNILTYTVHLSTCMVYMCFSSSFLLIFNDTFRTIMVAWSIKKCPEIRTQKDANMHFSI